MTLILIISKEMKNILTLLIFLLIIIINVSCDDTAYYNYLSYAADNSSYFFKSKCEDTKAKTGACMYTIYEYNENSIYGPKEYALFDKCGKGKYCSMNDKICLDKKDEYNKRESDKSCNYDKDCESNSCVNNKCTYASEGQICINKYGKYTYCKAGLVCDRETGDTESKCYKKAKENEDGTKHGCWLGLEMNDKICKKYGSLEDGDKVTSCNNHKNYLCKSGYCKQKKGEISYICASLSTEPTCNRGLVTSKGKWSDEEEILDDDKIINNDCQVATDFSGTLKFYYKYSQVQSKLYKKFLEDYNGLDLEEINTEGKCSSFEDCLEWKTYEKWWLYKNAPELLAAGFIDSEGEKKKDKKCEYDFILKQDNSSFIKLKALIIAIFALLF